MPHSSTYNKIIQHLRARTPLINLVMSSERLVDMLLPWEAGNNGLVEVDHTSEGLQRRQSGIPVVILELDCAHDLTVSGHAARRLTSAARDHLMQFVGKNRKITIMDFLKKSAGDEQPVAPLTQLARDLRNKQEGPVRVVLLARDMDPGNARLRRLLLTHAKQESGATVILTSQEPVGDPLLRTYMPVIRVERPSRQELSLLVERRLTELGSAEKIALYLNGDEAESDIGAVADVCADCLSGLHIPTALQVLMLHLESPSCRSYDADESVLNFRIDPEVLSREKAVILNTAGYVTLITDKVGRDDIGGLDLLKKWLTSRKSGFSKEAVEQSMRPPRGAILVGPPGTAKSMCARLTSSIFGMPLIRLDIGALFNRFLGDSERNVREALAVADASSPCILWLDEV